MYLPENKPAVIDIGSNSVRLYLPAGETLGYKELVSTQLGSGLSLFGVLNSDKIIDTANAVKSFYSKAESQGYSPIYVFATEAVRTAKNSHEFISLLAKDGIKVDVISGDAEAEIGYLGASAAFKGKAILFDIGGASIELMDGEDKKLFNKKSLPLGMVRLYDIFNRDKDEVNKYLSQQIHGFNKIDKSGAVYGIGGTATSLCAMSLNLKQYDQKKVHGAHVHISAVEQLIEISFSMPPEKLIKLYPTLSPSRAKIIGHGAVAVKTILDYLGKTGFTALETDNLEGYLIYKGYRK